MCTYRLNTTPIPVPSTPAGARVLRDVPLTGPPPPEGSRDAWELHFLAQPEPSCLGSRSRGYGDVYYASPLHRTPERDISVALGEIYPCRGQQKKRSLLSPSHFSELCLWSPSLAMNLLSLQSEEELSPRSLGGVSFCPLPLVFHQDVCLREVHSAATNTIPIHTWGGGGSVRARQVEGTSRPLETFTLSSISVSVHAPLENSLFFLRSFLLVLFFFFQ